MELVLSSRTQPRIGLDRVDKLEKIVCADDPFELEARTFVMGPDQMRFDATDDGQADGDAFAAPQAVTALGHEAMRGKIDDMQVDVAQLTMFADHLVIDGMPHCTAHVSYGQLCSCRHFRSSLLPLV